MSSRNTEQSFSTDGRRHIRGIATRSVLIALLVAASAFMAYRLVFLQNHEGSGRATPQSISGAGKEAGRSGNLLDPAGARQQSIQGKKEESGQIDPSLRLDLLSNSRAVSYSGSKRNIFVFGTTPSKGAGNAKPDVKPGVPTGGSGTGPTTPSLPPPPPSPPPVVIPLKFYGIAERSGTAHTKALLTNNDTILIAQVGQTVAQHFKILRIGLTKLELEDIRDHRTHDIPLEADSGGAPVPGGLPAAIPAPGLR